MKKRESEKGVKKMEEKVKCNVCGKVWTVKKIDKNLKHCGKSVLWLTLLVGFFSIPKKRKEEPAEPCRHKWYTEQDGNEYCSECGRSGAEVDREEIQ